MQMYVWVGSVGLPVSGCGPPEKSVDGSLTATEKSRAVCALVHK